MQPIIVVLAFFALTSAHMSLSFPAQFRSAGNKFTIDKDYDINSPITSSQFPCKGEHLKFPPGTPGSESVATLTPGAESQIEFFGTASHNGGSCQVALSTDQGASFKVLHSFIGACPVPGQSLTYSVPQDTPPGSALFAWTWFNNVGNREMYMGCASVTVGPASSKRQAPSVPFSSRPDLFKANIGNGCTTADATDLIFPDPGPDVTTSSSAKAEPPVGSCGGGGNKPADPAASSSKPAESSPAQSSQPSKPVESQSTQSSSATTFISSASTTSSAPATSGTGTPSAGGSTSVDGTCSGAKNLKCPSSSCCSSSSFCGFSEAHCGIGCQPAFGKCNSGGPFQNSSSRAPIRRRRFSIGDPRTRIV